MDTGGIVMCEQPPYDRVDRVTGAPQPASEAPRQTDAPERENTCAEPRFDRKEPPHAQTADGDAPIPDSGMPSPGVVPSRRDIRRCFSRVGFACFVLVAATTAVQLLLLWRFPWYVRIWLSSDWGYILYSLLPQYLVGAVLFYLILRRMPHESWGAEPLAAKDWWRMLLMCFGLGYGGSLIGKIVSLSLSLLLGTGATSPLDQMLASTGMLPQLVALVIVAPVLEELLFRRVLIDRLRRFGDRTAILVSALLFALIHGNFDQLFYAFFIGLLLGYIYCRTHRLLYTILMHATVNLLSGILLPLLLAAVPTDGAALLLSAGVMAVQITGLVLFFNRQKLAVYAPGRFLLLKHTRSAVIGNAGMILYLLLCGSLCVLALF